MDSRPVIMYVDSPIWARLSAIVRAMKKFHELERLELSVDVVDELIDELDFEDGTPEIFSLEVLGVTLMGIGDKEICERIHVVTPTLTIPVEFLLEPKEQLGIL